MTGQERCRARSSGCHLGWRGTGERGEGQEEGKKDRCFTTCHALGVRRKKGLFLLRRLQAPWGQFLYSAWHTVGAQESWHNCQGRECSVQGDLSQCGFIRLSLPSGDQGSPVSSGTQTSVSHFWTSVPTALVLLRRSQEEGRYSPVGEDAPEDRADQ